LFGPVICDVDDDGGHLSGKHSGRVRVHASPDPDVQAYTNVQRTVRARRFRLRPYIPHRISEPIPDFDHGVPGGRCFAQKSGQVFLKAMP
jgi:hypothetical protein